MNLPHSSSIRHRAVSFLVGYFEEFEELGIDEVTRGLSNAMSQWPKAVETFRDGILSITPIHFSKINVLSEEETTHPVDGHLLRFGLAVQGSTKRGELRDDFLAVYYLVNDDRFFLGSVVRRWYQSATPIFAREASPEINEDSCSEAAEF